MARHGAAPEELRCGRRPRGAALDPNGLPCGGEEGAVLPPGCRANRLPADP